jgi:hypothetical protein
MAVRYTSEQNWALELLAAVIATTFCACAVLLSERKPDAVIKENSDVESSGEIETVTVTGEVIQFDSSADRTLMHHMWENLVVSPK